MRSTFRKLKKYIRKMTPEFMLIVYHFLNACCASLYYGLPSKNMIVFGVTGTKGKTTTSEYLWSIFSKEGFSTGLIGTAHIRIGDTIIENKYHMSMPSPWVIQKFLHKMKKKGVTHVVIESSSEGLKFHRHIGIFYDACVFTNLSPEHLPSHGNSFEKYKKTKFRLFSYTALLPKVKKVPRYAIVNIDDPECDIFLTAKMNLVKVSFKTEIESKHVEKNDLETYDIWYDGNWISVRLHGIFNAQNAYMALRVARVFNVSLEGIKQGIESLSFVPGRVEEIILGQSFRVFIDYAHEKLSMTKLLAMSTELRKNHSSIHVLFGAEGGGRDKRKRKEMSHIVDAHADLIVVTTVDPYDENQEDIYDDIKKNIVLHKEGVNLFHIKERSEAISFLFTHAKKDDIVLITGKGAEMSITVKNKSIPWDERFMVRKLLSEFIAQK